MLSKANALLLLSYAVSLSSGRSLGFHPPAIGPYIHSRQAANDTGVVNNVTEVTQNTDALLVKTFGDASAMPELTTFEFYGPFSDLTIFMGASNIRGLRVTDMAGTVQEFLGETTGAEELPFTFSNNERIAGMSMVLTDDPTTASADAPPIGVGVKFNTNGGNNYDAEPKVTCKQLTYTDIDVGSGIIGRIHGKASAGTVYEFGIDMLDDVQSIAVTNMAYSGFTNNVAPSGPGERLVVGSIIVNNLNSTSPQSTTLQTTSTTTTSREINFSRAWTVGETITLAQDVNIPFISKTSVTSATNFGLTTTNGESESTAITKTDGALIPVVCKALKYCTGAAFFNQFKIDVDVNATFTATTKTGKTFQWLQSGNYKGADSTTVQLDVTENDQIIS